MIQKLLKIISDNIFELSKMRLKYHWNLKVQLYKNYKYHDIYDFIAIMQ